MKTITPKNALKLFLFLLILFSAKTFSHPKMPTGSNSGECESRIGCVTKAKKTSNACSATYAAKPRANAMQSKNMASRTTLTPRVSLKTSMSK